MSVDTLKECTDLSTVRRTAQLYISSSGGRAGATKGNNLALLTGASNGSGCGLCDGVSAGEIQLHASPGASPGLNLGTKAFQHWFPA